MLDDALRKLTSHDSVYWVACVQSLITKHSKPTKDPNHSETDSGAMLRELSDYVWSAILATVDLKTTDENMSSAQAMSLVLTLWTCRIRRAKAYDPRRPVELRKKAMERLSLYHHSLLECMMNEANDANYFPGQEWDCPYSPNAKNGDFV